MIKSSIIWNITRDCFWNCSYCCTSANGDHKRKNSKLSLEDKLKIVKNIDCRNVSIDISGGDPFIQKENIEVITELSKKFGREHLSVTATGRGLESVNLDYLNKVVREIGFTYDFPYESYPDRPLGYNYSNLVAIKKVVKRGIRTLAQTPLTKNNTSRDITQKIYKNLNDVGIENLLLMKFFESGRGIERSDLTLSREENIMAIKDYRRLEREYGSPKVKIAPSLKGKTFGKIFNSLNITSQGLLLSTPWAYGVDGRPCNWSILGDLKTKKLSKLTSGNICQRFLIQLNRNIRR